MISIPAAHVTRSKAARTNIIGNTFLTGSGHRIRGLHAALARLLMQGRAAASSHAEIQAAIQAATWAATRARTRAGIRTVIVIMIVNHSPAARAYLSGKLDTLLATDNTAWFSRSLVEEQAELNWLNRRNDMRAGLQLRLRARQEDSLPQSDTTFEQRVNQLFFTRTGKTTSYTLGRFNRADPLGFYTLDGLSVEHKGGALTTRIHAGRPIQIEDYRTVNAGRIGGIDIYHHAAGNDYLQNLDSHLGWQQLRDDSVQNYIHASLNAGSDMGSDTGSNAGPGTRQLKLFFTGSYLLENASAESVYTGIQAGIGSHALARLSYSLWQPKQASLSFKERFYSVYARGRQSVLQADFYYRQNWRRQLYARGRQVWREFGDNGYGMTAGIEQSLPPNRFDWQLQWDILGLDNSTINSLYLGLDKSITAGLRGSFNTALQYHQPRQGSTSSSGSTENRTVLALQAIAEQMLRSNLFIDFNASYVYDDTLDNEYRFGFRLSYRFDDRRWSRQ